MFPSVKITVSGLEKRTRYCILLEVVPASDRRQKYVESGGGVDETDAKSGGRVSSRGWMSTGFAEPQPEIDRRIYLHPDSPATGDHWMQQLPISFSKLKITNNTVEHQNNVSIFLHARTHLFPSSSSSSSCIKFKKEEKKRKSKIAINRWRKVRRKEKGTAMFFFPNKRK